jgi:hypothetical protein
MQRSEFLFINYYGSKENQKQETQSLQLTIYFSSISSSNSQSIGSNSFATKSNLVCKSFITLPPCIESPKPYGITR